MEELAKANLPITKRSLDTDQARKYFDRIGLKGKKELFQFRRESKTNIYSLDGYDNYFYGYYGTIDRIYSSIFGVCLSAWGSTSDSQKETDRGNRTIYTTAKTFHVMQRSREWTKTMGVDTVGALNDEITHGNINHLILLQEGLQEKLLADIADEIVSKNKRNHPDRRTVIFRENNIFPTDCLFSLKSLELTHTQFLWMNYFLDRELSPRDENGNIILRRSHRWMWIF